MSVNRAHLRDATDARHADASPRRTFADDVRDGLLAPRKTLPPKWFYDTLGSALFQAICALPEYYLTRAEDALLLRHGAGITRMCGPRLRLIELGCGSASKTRHLLRAALAEQACEEFVAVDIDADQLQTTAAALGEEFPTLDVRPVAGDFTGRDVLERALTRGSARNVVLLLGSTIGNLERESAIALMRDIRAHLQRGDAFLLGADLVKERQRLLDAYDDPTLVTAAFNLNVLGRINRELGGDFDLRSFRHRAVYNEEFHRIEMHLVSSVAQTVTLEAHQLRVMFEAGETIHTENSHKYTPGMLAEMAEESGFTLEHQWDDGDFADALLRA